MANTKGRIKRLETRLEPHGGGREVDEPPLHEWLAQVADELLAAMDVFERAYAGGALTDDEHELVALAKSLPDGFGWDDLGPDGLFIETERKQFIARKAYDLACQCD